VKRKYSKDETCVEIDGARERIDDGCNPNRIVATGHRSRPILGETKWKEKERMEKETIRKDGDSQDRQEERRIDANWRESAESRRNQRNVEGNQLRWCRLFEN
jgi:hypothetical protein